MTTTHIPDLLSQASLIELMSFQGRPCLSLYQPTHRSHPDNRQDVIRFRRLVGALETALRRQRSTDEVHAQLEPFEVLAQDKDFWNHTLGSLAVLGAPGLFRVFLLQRQANEGAELAMVADSFHLKPLRQFLRSSGRYQVLTLSRDSAQLFEGNGNTLDSVTLAPDVLRMMSAALGNDHSESHSTVSSYGGVGGGHMAMHHGHGGTKDKIDSDAERFFRAVDGAVLEQHSRPSGLPLMLVALPEHHHLFRQVSHNPFLMKGGLLIGPHGLTQDELRQRTWEVIAPQLEAQRSAWGQAYAAAAAKGLGSEDLSHVAHAAVSGRVETLLREAQREIAGRVDMLTGRIDRSDIGNPRVGDVLDDLGALVEKMGGQVHILPAECMPCRTGVAAGFRH